MKRTTGRLFLKRTESSNVVWKENDDLPAAYLVKAAVNLYALTGDKRYFDPVEREPKRLMDELNRSGWNWIPLLYSGERTFGYPKELEKFFHRWEQRTVNVAKA